MSFKNLHILLAIGFFAVSFACKKSDYIDSPDASLMVTDSVRFDTVFTAQGTATRYFKIFNLNKQKLRLSNIHLAGGASSAYQINVNGVSGTDFTDIDLEAGDSIYCFVRVYIDPTQASNPFLVQDSIGIVYNGNTRYVQLQAYGQNAVYLASTSIANDTVWKKDLPIVLLKDMTIPQGKTLTIEKGCKVYCHAKAGLLVNGRLLASGDTAGTDRISFATDRLDYVQGVNNGVDYRNLAGAWPGIEFGENSWGNLLQYVTIKNAVYALVDTLNVSVPPTTKLCLQGCVVQNNAAYGVLSRLGNMSIVNSLIANNGSGVGLYNGGQYVLAYNTLVGYSNLYVSHNSPVVMLNGTSSEPFSISITNSIFWGDNSGLNNEIGLGAGLGSNASIRIDHSLAKYASLPSTVQLTGMLQNMDPDFLLVNDNKPEYDFRLSGSSPCRGAAIPVAGIAYDISGNKRNTLNPAIGCYENP